MTNNDDFVRRDITLGLDFETHKELLSETFSDTLLNSDFNASLNYNYLAPGFYQLTIYYKPTEYLFEKFKILREHRINILSIIKQKFNREKWEYTDILNLSESALIEMNESPYWEHNKKPVILSIDNLEILIHSKYVDDGSFRLTDNVFQHINDYLQYGELGSSPYYNDKFIVENINRETSFGSIKFILSFEHFYDNSSTSIKSISIHREAYLKLTDDSSNVTDSQLLYHGKSLCLLMSFYWEKHIDFFNATLRVNDNSNYQTREILKLSDSNLVDASDYYLKSKFKTFYDFIESVDFRKYEGSSKLLHELIPRFLKTKNLDNIAAFMILYNIIEKIRNHFLLNPIGDRPFTIKEEFNFTIRKTQTDEFIKNKIKEIKVIVEELDVEEFVKKASDKVTFIRKTGLKEQFNNLLVYLEINPKSYTIDFTQLVKIRNELYHGNFSQVDLLPFNRQMTIMIYDMILKMITI